MKKLLNTTLFLNKINSKGDCDLVTNVEFFDDGLEVFNKNTKRITEAIHEIENSIQHYVDLLNEEIDKYND